MKTFLAFALLLIFSVSSFAGIHSKNNKNTKEIEAVSSVENVKVLQLTGVVVDEKSNETLAGATITIDGKKYYSDLDGNFSVIDVKPGKYVMVAELISYEPTSMVVDLTKDQNLNINLNQK